MSLLVNIHYIRWGEKNEKLFQILEGHEQEVTSVNISSDGSRIVTGSEDKTVKLWNLETKELINTFEGHNGGINSVAISDDRNYIASGSGDKNLIVWRLSDGATYGPFPHDNYIQCVKFISKSHLIITGDYNGTVRIWDPFNEFLDLESGLRPEKYIEEITDTISKKTTVFISYATLDSEKFKISSVARFLNKNYPDIETVLYWEEYMDDDIYIYMNDNLALADVVLVFCSKNANESDAVRTEWMAAHKMKKKIIPIFENEEDIPPLLTTKLGICFKSSEIKSFIHDLHALIQKKVKKIKIL